MNNNQFPSISPPRMLTIHATALTGILPETALRRLVKQGRCPGFYSGTKFLVNYDRLCAWLNETSEAPSEDRGGKFEESNSH